MQYERNMNSVVTPEVGAARNIPAKKYRLQYTYQFIVLM